MNLEKLLDGIFGGKNPRQYDKALRDWEAGRNLEEAAAIIYPGVDEQSLTRLVKMQEEGMARLAKVKKEVVAERREKGKKVVIEGLGTLTHNGEEFAVKKKTLVYPKSAVVVSVEAKLASNAAVGKLWAAFCRREKTLVGELESAIAKYYREICERPGWAGIEPMRPLKRNADIWRTLGKPEFSFLKRGRGVELELSWSPTWEDEHGLYVYLSRDAKIRHVGEFEG